MHKLTFEFKVNESYSLSDIAKLVSSTTDNYIVVEESFTPDDGTLNHFEISNDFEKILVNINNITDEVSEYHECDLFKSEFNYDQHTRESDHNNRCRHSIRVYNLKGDDWKRIKKLLIKNKISPFSIDSDSDDNNGHDNNNNNDSNKT